MKIDNDPMLESDHLEELLETPAPSPPVVVVQYRNRGVPSWIFVPVVVLIPLAFVFYHRMFVEPNRVRAAQDRALLLRQIEADRANQPLVRENGASTTVLPKPDPVTSAAGTPVADETKAVSDPSKSGAEVASLPAQSQATRVGTASPNPPGIIGQSGPIPSLRPVSDNRSPFEPPISTDGIGSTANVGNAGKTSSTPTGDLTGSAAQGAIQGQLPAGKSDIGRSDPAGDPGPGAQVAVGDGRIGPQALPPLPTREEARREIEEEANKREAAIMAQLENKNSDLRSKWLEEQLKFRQELAEVVHSKGIQSGPDIATLDKRYGYQGDPVLYQVAYQKWRLAKKSEKAKVDDARLHELPESAIFEFMCASLHTTIGTRGGPRDENEVRVRAAKLLLKYPLVTASPDRRPEKGRGVGRLALAKKNCLDPAVNGYCVGWS